MFLRFANWRNSCFFSTNFMVGTALIMCLFMTTWTQAQEQCEQARQQAEEKFRANAYVEVVALLNRCLTQGGLSDSSKVYIYVLLSRAYLASQDSVSAASAISSLLNLAPAFAPGEDNYTSGYRNFFQAVKSERQVLQPATPQPLEVPAESGKNLKKSRSKKWLWIGAGGAAAAGITAAVILGSGNNDGPVAESFVPPPGRPR
jgi:hypothetical protein